MPLKRSRQDTGAKQACNSSYFESYGNISVHSLMLKDAPRMDAYFQAIQQSRDAIDGKIVLDVGSGTGILSMMCAKTCNPKHVYAVEANQYIADISRMIIEQNGLSDRITVISKPVEEISSADWKHGSEKASVVISEWMGFYLVHESMLESVLWARDFLCEPNPLLLPSNCRIWVSIVSNEEFRQTELEVWGKPLAQYGNIDMSTIGMVKASELISSPQIEVLDKMQLLSVPQVAFEFDLLTIDRLKFSTTPLSKQLCLPIVRDGVFSSIGIWFDCSFKGTDVVLDTSPFQAATHWKQTNVFLGCWAAVPKGIPIDFNLIISKPDLAERQYTITIET